jgi:hypothetical protein
VIELPPRFSLDEIFAVQQALIDQCELLRDRFAILDAPRFRSGAVNTSFSDIQSWRLRFDTRFAALYFPWIDVFDPWPGRRETLRAMPPSGHVAGELPAPAGWTRTSRLRRANPELRSAMAVCSGETADEHD